MTRGSGYRQAVTGFSAKVDNVVSVASLLKAISFDEKVNVIIRPKGMLFVVEQGKCVQASVFIPKEEFSAFSLSLEDEEEELSFNIPFKELLDCLKVFYSDSKNESLADNSLHTSMSLSYEGHGSPFELRLNENGVVTQFELRTYEVDDLMTIDFTQIDSKVILRADAMKDLFAELEGHAPEKVKLQVPLSGTIKITGSGIYGEMVIEIPVDGSIVESFECTNPGSALYSFPMLRNSFKALHLSRSVAIKLDPQQTLSITFMLPLKTSSFVEFFCLPQTHEDDD